MPENGGTEIRAPRTGASPDVKKSLPQSTPWRRHCPRNCLRSFRGPSVTNSCQNAVLLSRVLRRLKRARYFHCVICITEFVDQIVVGPRSSDRGPRLSVRGGAHQTTQRFRDPHLDFKQCTHRIVLPKTFNTARCTRI